MSEDKPQDYKKRLSQELTNSFLFREDPGMWTGSELGMPGDLQDMIRAADQGYDGLYSGGPPSVHSGHTAPTPRPYMNPGQGLWLLFILIPYCMPLKAYALQLTR